MFQYRRSAALPLVLVIACATAAFAACGGGAGETTTAGTGSGAGDASTSSGTSPGSGGAGGGDIIVPGAQALTIDPPTATVTITDKGVAASTKFTALLDGQPAGASLAWSLSSYSQGSIAPSGTFTTTGINGGEVTVTVAVGGKTANAKLIVKVQLSEKVDQGAGDPGVSPDNEAALHGAPLPDPGLAATPPNPSKILYPYDKTVVPRGLTAPLLQFSPGTLPPEDAKITLSSPYFSWDGYIHLKNSAQPQFYIPQDIWDAALLSAGGQDLSVDVVKAVGGAAYGPAHTSVIVAPGSLKGAVYYMTYEAPPGLYVAHPGQQKPAELLIGGCAVCHSASSNGTRLATGIDERGDKSQSGVFTIDTTGTATRVSGPPAGLGGDSRDLSFATFTPDGDYVMRSQNNFWGGINQLAWRVNDAGHSLDPATVVGLGENVSAYLPAISHDSKHYAFTNGADGFGTESRSISLMDLSIDKGTDTLTFSNRQLLLDNGVGGAVAKFVSFLPDPGYLILQEGNGYLLNPYREMLPTWDAASTSAGSTGALYMLNTATKEHLELSKMNAGNVESDKVRNYEPFTLPVTAGGYFWVVFTSRREYGNVFAGAAARKQLWVGAISINPAPGEDPSHPPFYLPNQSDTANERGFWALEPCKSEGNGCESGDECCDGFCRPEDASDPASARVCKPPSGGCSQTSEKCGADADCCDSGAGTRCIGGFCAIPTPK